MTNNQRKLSAIMFTDMVGYSAITQEDESLALELLEEHRQILRPLFPKYSGQEVETAGDSFFVEFSSALEAVKCAIEIQKALRDRNKSMTEERQIKIRIGVHLGDVVHSGKNVLGDGVNIAARIEPFAQTCGICVSQDVARQIQNKIDYPLKKIEKKQLKNIRLPVDIYAVVLPWLEKGLSSKSEIITGKSSWMIIGVLLALAVIILGIFTWPVFINRTINKNSIAVLPFKNLSDNIENEYFSDGMTEDIIAHLSKIGGLRVISRTSVMQYKNTEKKMKDIGYELNVATILEGSVRRDNKKVRIVAQLVDAQQDEYLWSETYNEELTQIFGIQSAVAEKIARSLKAKISQTNIDRMKKKSTESLEAYDLYLKGRYHFNKRMPDDLKKSIIYFERALEIDPKYALAYSGLADSYMILGNYSILPPNESFDKAKDAAKKALEINDRLAEAHTSLAFTLMHVDWNWKEAKIEFEKAIELDPGYATAYYLYASYMTVLKQFDEAKKFRNRAKELDPLSPAILLEEGLELYFEKKYDQTIELCQKILQIDPQQILAYIPLGGAHIQKSMYQEAIKLLSKASYLSTGHPVIVAAVGYAYAMSGRDEDAQNMIEILLERSEEEYVSPFWMAIVYVGLNNESEVFHWLYKAYQQRDGSLVFLNVFPIFDNYRSDPRFIELLKKIGLL